MTIDIEKCAQDVYERGESIGLFVIPKETANAICAGISAVTGARVDWHYIAGRVHMKALAAPTASPALHGWKLVPVVPTDAMLTEIMSPGEADATHGMTAEHRAMLMARAGIKERYEAMLEAAPQHQSAFTDDEVASAASLLEQQAAASPTVPVSLANVDELVPSSAVGAEKIDSEAVDAGLNGAEGNVLAAANADPHGGGSSAGVDLHDRQFAARDQADLLAACRRAVVALAAASEVMPEFKADYQAMHAALAARREGGAA